MLKFFFGNTLFKVKTKEHKAMQRINVYTNGYGSKPFPNAYAHL